MLAKVYSASVQGLDAQQVTIEVNSSRGIRFVLVGLPDNAVKESHERITAALLCGIAFCCCHIRSFTPESNDDSDCNYRTKTKDLK